MTFWALVFMLTSWTVITGVTVYCFYRLLTSKRNLQADEPEE